MAVSTLASVALLCAAACCEPIDRGTKVGNADPQQAFEKFLFRWSGAAADLLPAPSSESIAELLRQTAREPQALENLIGNELVPSADPTLWDMDSPHERGRIQRMALSLAVVHGIVRSHAEALLREHFRRSVLIWQEARGCARAIEGLPARDAIDAARRTDLLLRSRTAEAAASAMMSRTVAVADRLGTPALLEPVVLLYGRDADWKCYEFSYLLRNGASSVVVSGWLEDFVHNGPPEDRVLGLLDQARYEVMLEQEHVLRASGAYGCHTLAPDFVGGQID